MPDYEQLGLPFEQPEIPDVFTDVYMGDDGELEPVDLPTRDRTGDDEPALLTVNPTSTTNPARPRTLAAGYDARRQIMTVLFRDGTLWNYLDVTATMWSSFRQSYSKGVWIAAFLDPRGPGGGGQAVQAGSGEFYAEAITAYARAVQQTRKGTQFRNIGKTVYPNNTPIKLSGYQNRVQKYLRQGLSATEAVRRASQTPSRRT